MPNLLEFENSPYLLQHKDNPVNWYPWGADALEHARSENKPIFLSVGYAACHWCHVMEEESFEDLETAKLMNENFINIKVDREERPDIDSLYMNAVVAMTGQGGWPMSVFLTPAGEPFYGGTYFPPVRRYNMPAFREVLKSVAAAWDENPEQIIDSGGRITQHLRQSTSLQNMESTVRLDENMVQTAVRNLIDSYDTADGGWGVAPKFPQPMVIEFLIQQLTKKSPDTDIQPTVCHVLDKMALGGMYDVIGGGFARYSTDNHWLVPHFEKMLYDNAQLSQVYLYAYILTGDSAYKHVCEQTLAFIKREMQDDSGGFFSSLDADSEGEEGKFYIWSPDEIASALSDKNDYEFIFSAYHIPENGNFEGKTVLQRQKTDSQLAELFNADTKEIRDRLASCHKRLLAYRSKRIRPGTDDKILVSWNALTLISFAEAARYLDSGSFLETAQKNAQFILASMHDKNRLYRSWRHGKIRHNAYLEDYAALILGLVALYQADFDANWYQDAVMLTEEMVANFEDRNGNLYDTRNDHEELFIRPKNIQDNATPSGCALASLALLKMAALSGRGAWRDIAERELSSIQTAAVTHPTAFGKWLCAIDFAVSPTNEIAVLGDPAADNTDKLIKAVNARFRPYSVVAASPFPHENASPPLVHNRSLVDGKPTAYVCHNFICKNPIINPQVLAAELG